MILSPARNGLKKPSLNLSTINLDRRYDVKVSSKSWPEFFTDFSVCNAMIFFLLTTFLFEISPCNRYNHGQAVQCSSDFGLVVKRFIGNCVLFFPLSLFPNFQSSFFYFVFLCCLALMYPYIY